MTWNQFKEMDFIDFFIVKQIYSCYLKMMFKKLYKIHFFNLIIIIINE